MKGKERVCNVTEADRLGAREGRCLSGEVSSCEVAVSGATPLRRERGDWVLPLCAAVLCGGTHGLAFGVPPVIKRKEGHLVDALALRGDEGRGTLRKARGRCERSVIPGSPNGATHPQGYHDLNS